MLREAGYQSVWLWLFLGELVLHLMLPVGSVGRKVLVRVGISLSAVPMLLLLLRLAMSLIGGSLLTFQFLLAFALALGWLMLLALLVCQPVWPACWLNTPDRSGLLVVLTCCPGCLGCL